MIRGGSRVLALAKLRLTDTFRNLTSTAKKRALITALWLGLTYLAVQPDGEGLYYYGTLVAAGEQVAAVESVRRVFLGGVVFLWLMFAFRAAVRTGKLEPEDRGMVTAMPNREFLAGVFLSEVVLSVVVLGSAVVVGALAFGYGAGSVVPVLPLAIGGLIVVGTAPVLTYPIGLAANLVLRGLKGNQRVGTGLIFLVGYYLAVANFDQFAAALAATPVSRIVDAMVVVDGGSTVHLLIVVGWILGLAAMMGAAMAISLPLARSVWFSGSVSDADGVPPGEVSVAGGPLERVLPPRIAAIVDQTWRRARRNPYTLMYVVPSLVAIAVAYVEVVSTGRLPNALPWLVALLGSLAVGSALTLNVFGAEGDALPWVLTSPIDAREYVLGHALAASLVGVPAVVIGVTAAVFTTTYGPGAAAAVLALGAVLAGTAPFISLSLGLAFPQFAASEPINGMPTALPSRYTAVGASVVLLAVGAPGAVGLAYGSLHPPASPLAPTLGVLVSIIAATIGATLGYRHATRHFEQFTFPIE